MVFIPTGLRLPRDVSEAKDHTDKATFLCFVMRFKPKWPVAGRQTQPTIRVSDESKIPFKYFITPKTFNSELFSFRGRGLGEGEFPLASPLSDTQKKHVALHRSLRMRKIKEKKMYAGVNSSKQSVSPCCCLAKTHCEMNINGQSPT